MSSQTVKSQHSDEIRQGGRFDFGANWHRFLAGVTEAHIQNAVGSMQEMLDTDTLEGCDFLDVGSGSGLSSLAARRMGARVHSFDYDPVSVASTRNMREKFAPGDANWTISEGSILDETFVAALPQADVVYSWGVLHHTGQMYRAFDLVYPRVKPGGRLFIAIYHDTGSSARRWRKVKKFYCSGPFGRWTVMALFAPREFILPFLRDLMKLQNPLRRYKEFHQKRGMTRFHDWIDWIGGYPYEFAKPEQIFNHFKNCGFDLLNMKLTKHNACNQFVFRRRRSDPHTI
ncbi:MAG: class I SAM-dependent methyltransferase [Magnetococcales bacterium]|nr:class I SAM-dependent methyltransferase [Magnetococcales bacterium]